MPEDSLQCRASGCKEAAADGLPMCHHHWRFVPHRTQIEVLRAFSRLNDKPLTSADIQRYADAVRSAVTAVVTCEGCLVGKGAR
jgi:hypothetical protein